MLQGFRRTPPREWNGTPNPEDMAYEEEVILRSIALVREARATAHSLGWTTEFPKYERWLNMQPYDDAPARALAEKHEALTYPHRFTFWQAELEIDEGVFDPSLTKVSPFLCETILRKERVNFSVARVLDTFAGSGVFGVIAALRGAHVVGFDKSPQAVRCARKNAECNGVSNLVDVREGTLHEVIRPPETFDIVLANPPLIPGDPENPLEVALFDRGLQATRELVEALPQLLAKHGRCYLVTSDVIDRLDYKVPLRQLCRDSGLAMTTVSQLHLPYESYRVHRIERKTAAIYARTMLKNAITSLNQSM